MSSGLISSLCSSSISTTRYGNSSFSSPANWYLTNPTLATRCRLRFLRFNRFKPPLLHNCLEYINSSWDPPLFDWQLSSPFTWQRLFHFNQSRSGSGVGGAKAVTKHGSLFSFTWVCWFVRYYNTQTQQTSGLLLIHFTCSHINTDNV